MKAISSNMTRTIQVGTRLNCADNSGAKVVQMISVRGYKGRRRMRPSAGVASLITVRVYKGDEKVRHEVLKAVIIRQRKEYRRPDGMRISFADNAAVIVDDKFDPKGTLIKGPVAREVIERFQTIGKIASIVV